MIEKKFKAVVLDLDDTLFDTWSNCYPAAANESCAAMIKAGLNCSKDDCLAERQHYFSIFPRGDVIHHLVKKFGIKKGTKSGEEIEAIGKKAFHSRNVEKDIRLFPGAYEVLSELKAKYLLFLVTSGDPQTQKQKVELLKIREFFTQVFYVNSLSKEKKSFAFLEIINHTSMKPHAVLCVGDRRDREIAEGKRLGFVTCLVNRAHHIGIQPDLPEENPDFEIDHLEELIKKCQL